MPINDSTADLFQGFSKLDRQQRFARLVEMGALTLDEVKYLDSAVMPSTELAEHLIENVIGYFPMPLGVATNFCIDGKNYVIPMAVEETSIIAALSKTAKWIRHCGEMTTQVIGNSIIGQIQISQVSDFEKLCRVFNTNKDYLIHFGNTHLANSLVKRGGGITDIRLRNIMRDDGEMMAVFHVHMDSCDAMGANIINQVCEGLKEPIERLSQESVTMCILSNLSDTKLTQAHVTIRQIEPEIGYRLQEASLFAEYDSYRAATNNKGVLNGMDALLIATGNDWRAVEAGVHAYAARSGQYRSITQWRMQSDELIGTIEAPIMLGTVGGVTQLHPTAKLCLRMLGIEHANELARIVAAVGLVQNLGAIRALTTDGIIKGHMKLHIDNLAISAGANDKEIPVLKQRLRELLSIRKRITLSHAQDILHELRTDGLQPMNERTL